MKEISQLVKNNRAKACNKIDKKHKDSIIFKRNEKADCLKHNVCNWIREDKLKRKTGVTKKVKHGSMEDEEKERIMEKVKWRDHQINEEVKYKEIVTFGDVTLSKVEIAFLKNPPDHALFGSINKDIIRVEIEIGLAKVRLSRRNRYDDDEDLTEEEKEKYEFEDAKTRMVYDYDTEKIDFGNRRPTDCKNNRRTYLPQARPVKEEAELHIRKEAWTEIINNYRGKYCKGNGNQKASNLTNDEKIGLESIIKRVNDNEIVVQVSDKCHRLCVSTV